MTSTCVNTTISHSRPQRRSVLTWIIDAWNARRERAALAELDDHLLDDLGLSYRDAHKEATRPIWDVPSHWQM